MSLMAWRDAIQSTLGTSANALSALLPRLLGAAVALAIGLGLAHLLESAARRSLRHVGLDRLADRTRLSDAMRRAGFRRTASELVARGLFWALFLIALLSVTDALGLGTVTATVDRLVAWLPNLLGAAVIVVFGFFIGHAVERIVGSEAALGRLGSDLKLGALANFVVVGVAAVVAIEQLGVDADLLVALVTTAALTAGLTVGVTFALGARGVASHVLAGHFLRQRLEIGAEAEALGSRGIVVRIGTVDTVLAQGDRSVSIPNGVLLDQVVVR
jgi:hypothetical protein